MRKIRIVTDSTADLTKEEIEKFDIRVIPLSITIENEQYLDGIEITSREFMEKMKNAKELPKSSQPSTGEFLEIYEQAAKDGFEVLSIHMTGQLSGTVRSAESASRMTNAKVTVVDSSFISRALAFQVIEAAEMAIQGKEMEEILLRLHHIREHTRLFVVVDTLENLAKGGRIGKGKAMLGTLLNIKPIAALVDGEYTPVSKARSYTQVVRFLDKQFNEDVKGKTISGVGLVHADGYELAVKLKNYLIKTNSNQAIEIGETTPIISTHTGAGAIGFMYYFE